MQRIVQQDVKIKKDAKRILPVSPTKKEGPSEENCNDSQYKDNMKFRRALESYLIRKDREFGEQMLV